MDAAEVERFFTRSDGTYLFARWGRPIAPIVFGVEDATLGVVKGALEAVCAMAGHQMAETDPELGANVMVFFFRDWAELLEVRDLDRLINGLVPLVARLTEAEANQYRVFRFDEAGAIKACFMFLRMDSVLSAQPAETLALSQAISERFDDLRIAFGRKTEAATDQRDGVLTALEPTGALLRPLL
ncbi:MAG: hypothetical protein NWQ37_15330, partial [Marivita lacus]|nr:hypothetical protein [Marivita lacus]